MPLIGSGLLVTLGLLLGAGLVAVLLLWNRVRGSGPAKVAQRLGMLVSVQVIATLLTAAAVNDYGFFYGSWSDLVWGNGGVGQIHAVSDHASRHLHRAPDPRLGFVPESAWAPPAQFADRGELASATVRGTVSGLASPVLVYLPPQYFAAADAHAEFPVVEAVSGFPGTVQGLSQRMGYADDELAIATAHTARPTVLVLVASAVEPRHDTECTNVPAGPQVESFLATDVPSAVRSTFRVKPLGWGVMGDSTGGYCAVKLAMDHPDLYRAAVSMSGYYHTYRESNSGSLWGGSSVVQNLNNPEWRLRHQPAPPISVLATIGSLERGSDGIRDTHAFLSLVRPPMTASVLVIRGGGHNFADWEQVTPKGLVWLSARTA